jgi:acyl-CoA reductase-like NAD-dependent aldehyde dehydrogenase
MNTRIPVRNPRTDAEDYFIMPPSASELREKVLKLRAAQAAWQGRGVEGRIEVMQRWKEAVERHHGEMIDALIADTGRKHETLLEASLLASSIERWCNHARQFFAPSAARPSSVPFIEVHQGLQPFQLVGVISPWNFPLLLSIIDAIPALLAGCTVIVKPSEITPRFIEPMLAGIGDVPELAEVFTYVAGAGETGSDIIQNVDLVCFTGSVATGRKVYQAAADRFIPAFLELGGKDAALVFEGADLDHATSALLWGSVVNTGQSCLSIERIYVQDTVFERFVAMLVEKAKKLTLAYPTPESGEIGPVISEKQVAIINEHLRDALDKGATLLTGDGHCVELGGGHWCLPTVLTNVNHTMKVMTEETFGPVLPVMPFSTREQAIELANSTMFGLSGAVFARTWEEAMSVGSQMQCGAVSINDAALTAIVHDGEKQSFKFSGIGGTRMGPSAMKRFMRQQTFLTKKQALASPWWFSA